VIGWALRAPRQSDRTYSPPQPTVIMAPPSFPAPGAITYPASQQVVSAAPGARREFTTIGEEEIVYHESESVW
jgi:hypothetical protein